MARKLLFSILLLSFAVLELLAVRQGQINTVHEMTKMPHSIDRQNETLNALSIQIETVCSPMHIQQEIASAELIDDN